MTIQEANFEGILLIDKPSGMTSHDVVDRLREKVKNEKNWPCGYARPNGYWVDDHAHW